MSNTSHPYDKLILDKEEQALENAPERGEFESSSNLLETRTILQEAARMYKQLHTAKPVTLRINQLDLIKIKAKRSNIPCQTLLGAVLHDFAENHIEIKF